MSLSPSRILPVLNPCPNSFFPEKYEGWCLKLIFRCLNLMETKGRGWYNSTAYVYSWKQIRTPSETSVIHILQFQFENLQISWQVKVIFTFITEIFWSKINIPYETEAEIYFYCPSVLAWKIQSVLVGYHLVMKLLHYICCILDASKQYN